MDERQMLTIASRMAAKALINSCSQIEDYLVCNKGCCIIRTTDSFDNGF